MTDTGVALWMLVLCLAAGAIITVSQGVTFGRRLWLDTRSGVNGPATVILRGTIRRLVIRLVLQSALLVQFGARLVGVRPRPLVTLIVVLVIVLALAADTVGDTFDYRLLRWLLRRDEKEPGA